MSARRRRRRRGGGGGNSGDGGGGDQSQNKGGGGQKKGGGDASNKGGGGGGNRGGRGKGGGNRRKRGNNRRRGRGGSRRRDNVGLWGDAKALPEARSDVRITDDPSALARSLGAPPLPGHDEIAKHYFRAVYERSVMVAGALAAAGGLLEPEELEDELGES